MKAMKKKAVSKIAKGRFAKSAVLRGNKEKTSGGLKASDLVKNERGKIVSKKMSEVSKHCWALDAGRQEGTRGPEAQGLCRDQEGHSTLHQGEGALRKVRLLREVCGSRTHGGASSRC